MNYIKDNKIIIGVIFFTIILIFFIKGAETVPIEEIYPLVGVGYDLEKNSNYSVPFTVYNYKGEDRIFSRNITGVAKTIGETREERQLKMDKVFKLGSERELIISKNQAVKGIDNLLNILFTNADMNDRVLMMVSEDKAIDILSYRIRGYPSSSEYIEGMIKNATSYNFLSSEHNLLNAYVRVSSEGENLVLPYIGLDEKGLSYLGMALFKKNKMVETLDIKESRVMNMLREEKGNGLISIQKDSKRYINYIAKAKRKVRCNKKENKYEFIIDLNFNGDIMLNTLYKDMDKAGTKEVEEKLANNIETMCNDFIYKMKNELKIDCLQLAMYAVAKYGRDTGVDWDEIVCNSDIKVNVKVNVDKIGRGNY